MPRTRRTAFSLSELLIIIAFLGILSAMFFPVILQSRQKAARARRANNMRQIGIAVNNYDGTYKHLPLGVNENNFSAATQILPFVEQDQVYTKIDFKKPVDDKANLEVAKTLIPVLQSDSDPVKTVDGLPGTNILFCAGSKAGLEDNDGVFGRRKAGTELSLATIPAGTSNTMMAAETLKGDGSDRATDVRRQYVKLDKGYLKNLKDDSGVEDFKDGKHIAGNRCANWMDGRFLQGTFNTTRLPNSDKPDVDCGGAGGLMAARSLDGYIVIGYFDGHVQVIESKKVTLNNWQDLSNAYKGYGGDFGK